jgi:hypothetical protein
MLRGACAPGPPSFRSIEQSREVPIRRVHSSARRQRRRALGRSRWCVCTGVFDARDRACLQERRDGRPVIWWTIRQSDNEIIG